MLKLIPTRLKPIIRKFRDQRFNLLDVGAGSHSASLTKRWFPLCRYYGIDKTTDYDNDEYDFSLMDGFYQLDLSTLRFEIIPDNFFDVIIMSHIIEHLRNGNIVIERLAAKLKRGGVILYMLSFQLQEAPNFPL